ncbi:hypothetical protein ARAM_004300 [Aspergillus rambellii]|uniref:Uncharacterized protein n=1 Tax=Aspergillus rambellii TaxID=308745 RepID=A0A0F8V729_9EURO|nr:hypothetical protein ARAM_004300 [Aspergillus rambellii]
MGSGQRSASYLWELALRKLFPKRTSLTRRESSISSFFDSSQIDDHTDGFYKYSQELLEEENQRLRSSNSTSASYTSALMAPVEYPALPYNVSSPDWNIFSSAVKYLDETADEDISEWLHSVLSVYSRVYTVSKIVMMAFLHYGVDLEDLPDGILSHLRRAEELVKSNSIVELIDSTESLYYAVYARLIMEIASVELCSTFTLEVRHLATYNSFILPEPAQLCRILLVCKRALDDPYVCSHINKELVKQHQDQFIRRSMNKLDSVGFILDDLVGYRRYVLSIINEKSSEFCRKWSKASMMYQMPTEEVLTIQSEKYLAFIPRRAVHQVVPTLDLPFIDPHTFSVDIWEREVIVDNRLATLAKLEGKCIGDVRREDNQRRLIDLVRGRKCICRSVCTCAWDCTLDVERHCPCSEQKLSLMVAKRRRSVALLPFGLRCSILARAIFQGIASLRADVNSISIVAEMDRALVVFMEEIRKQRLEATTSDGNPI